jgi:hypothetical protein
MVQPDREIRALRNDVRASCERAALDAAAAAERLARVVAVLEEMVAAEGDVAQAVAAVTKQLQVSEGQPVRVVGQGAPLLTTPSASSEGASESNFEGLEASVEQSVLTDAETSNSNMWGIAGLFCGFMTLGALFKVVRP